MSIIVVNLKDGYNIKTKVEIHSCLLNTHIQLQNVDLRPFHLYSTKQSKLTKKYDKEKKNLHQWTPCIRNKNKTIKKGLIWMGGKGPISK